MKEIRRSTWLWLGLILLFAAAIRLIQLETAPTGGHGDVAWIGINALDWVDHGVFPYYVYELYAPEPMIVWLEGLAIPLFGISFFSSRLVTVIFGLLLVGFLFPATWWLLGDQVENTTRERAALLASAAAALSMHASYISRLGMRAALFPALVTLLIWVTAWAWRRGGWQRWSVAGAALAFMQYAYIPARLVPIMLALWFAHGYLTDRALWRKRWRGWVLMAVVSFVLTLPNLITFVNTPEAFSARADVGGANTGGWVWEFDAAEEGGILNVIINKIALEILALGIQWQGPYSVMGLPMLSPLFFIGLLVAFAYAFRHPRSIALLWMLLALPVMLSTDLISGAVVEIHGVRQTGFLAPLYILAGVGLAFGWDWLNERLQSSATHRLLPISIIVAALIPTIWAMNEYLNVYIPTEYTDSVTGWKNEQIDVDISNRILEQSDRAYLLPYDEYNRSNIAWLLSDVFRNRHSALDSDGNLQLPDLPDEITVVTAISPDRIRHDGRPSQWDQRLWVLLIDGQTLLLPPLNPQETESLLNTLDNTAPEILQDRSQTNIANFYTVRSPDGFLESGNHIDYPLDATFSLGDQQELGLVGYTLPDQDLTPGEVVYITLFWKTLQAPSEDYEVFVQLWDDAGNVIAATHDFPYSGNYRSRIWQPDEITVTHHWVQLPDTLETGRYTIAAGLFRILHNERLTATGTNAVSANGTALARDLRYPSPPVVEPGTPLTGTLRFGDVLDVAGLQLRLDDRPLDLVKSSWDIDSATMLTMAITWDVLQRPSLDYSLFLHLTPDETSPPLAQADQSLGAALYPSGVWREGDRLQDQVTMTLPADLPPGAYDLWLGVYFYGDNSRLQPLWNGDTQPDGRYHLGRVLVGEG